MRKQETKKYVSINIFGCSSLYFNFLSPFFYFVIPFIHTWTVLHFCSLTVLHFCSFTVLQTLSYLHISSQLFEFYKNKLYFSNNIYRSSSMEKITQSCILYVQSIIIYILIIVYFNPMCPPHYKLLAGDKMSEEGEGNSAKNWTLLSNIYVFSTLIFLFLPFCIPVFS